MEFAIGFAIVIGLGVLFSAVCAGLGTLYDRAREEGSRSIQQQAVDRGFASWEIYRGKPEFQWKQGGEK